MFLQVFSLKNIRGILPRIKSHLYTNSRPHSQWPFEMCSLTDKNWFTFRNRRHFQFSTQKKFIPKHNVISDVPKHDYDHFSSGIFLAKKKIRKVNRKTMAINSS